ncbi:hypothetical protein C3488_30685 [Streptomyces sp. Ru72]|nr:hypothetical protein C3488_30685 [Streptomyces sp. Ru72]
MAEGLSADGRGARSSSPGPYGPGSTVSIVKCEVTFLSRGLVMPRRLRNVSYAARSATPRARSSRGAGQPARFQDLLGRCRRPLEVFHRLRVLRFQAEVWEHLEGAAPGGGG